MVTRETAGTGPAIKAKLTIIENFRAVFYAPFYVLKSLGYAAQEGLDVEWVPANTPGGAIERVKRGEAHLTWGGPMRIMKDHDCEPESDRSLVGFCEVVGRDPFALVARREHLPLDLTALPERRLAVVTEVPTPWLCLQADLRDAGIDPAAMTQVSRDRSQEAQLAALKAGEIDVMQAFEPYVSLALADPGFGLAYDAAGRGPTTYTVFIATRAGIRRHATEFAALTSAMARTQQWMADHPADIAGVCAAYFPDVEPSILQRSVERYMGSGVWSAAPPIQEQGFERLAHSLLAGGFITTPATFQRCIYEPRECAGPPGQASRSAG